MTKVFIVGLGSLFSRIRTNYSARNSASKRIEKQIVRYSAIGNDLSSAGLYRLYWVDQSLPGIRSIRQNQTEHRVLLHTSVNDTVHDVTVYQVLQLRRAH